MRCVAIAVSVVVSFSSLVGESKGTKVEKPPVMVRESQKANTPFIQRKKLTQEEIQRLKEIQKEIKEIQNQALLKVKEIDSRVNAMDETELRKVQEIKVETELKVLRLRREIAKIKGNNRLVKEFDRAIDNIKHPEKYRKPPVETKREIPSKTAPVIKETK